MFKQLFLSLILTLALNVASAGEMVLLEEAAEFEALSVRVSDNGSGKFRLNRCEGCDEIRLKITSGTSLEIGGKAFPLSALNTYTLRDGTVFYRAKDRVVTRITAAR